MIKIEDIQAIERLYAQYRQGSIAPLLKSIADLVSIERKLYLADVNVVAVSDTPRGLVYVKYTCTSCNYSFWGKDKGEPIKCPMCNKPTAIKTNDVLSVPYVEAKVFINFEDAGSKRVDAIFLGLYNRQLLAVKGGKYRVVACPVLINKDPCLVIIDLVDVKVRGDRWIYIANRIRSHRDFTSRLSEILTRFASDSVHGMYEEKALLLAAVVGAGKAYVGARSITDILSRYWMNIAWFGPAETGKSQLASYVLKSAPDMKALLLTGSKHTIPGLIVSGFGGQLMLGPLALLDGEETDFGVMIIEEAERLVKDYVLDLKHALEHGKFARATGTTGYVPVQTRCTLILIGNLLEGAAPPDCFPDWLRDSAVITRMDAIMVSFHPETEDEAGSIVRWKLRGGTYSIISPEDWSVYLKHCREHRVQIDVRNIEGVIDTYRRELATAINSIFRVSIKGFRIADSLLRIAIALAKLTLCDVVSVEHVEYAAKLIDVMLTRIRTLKRTHLRPITKYQLAKLLFDDGLIEYVLRPDETVTIDELYERLKRELFDRGYMLSRQVLEQVLESEKAKMLLTFPETGKVKLAR